MNKQEQPIGLRIFSVLVGLSALGHFTRIPADRGSLLWLITLGVAICGLVTCIGLWRREKWGSVAFVVWAVFILARQLTQELTIEAAQWEEVLLGFVLTATILAICVAYVRSQLREAV